MRLKVASDSVEFGSNINDVIIPEEMKKKFYSGLDFFDAALGGQGFTPSSSMIFTGEAGAGKTTMMLTLADRITRSGAVAVFNTAEESLFQVKAACDRLGLKKGFAVGSESNIGDLIKKADKFRALPQNAGKPFMLIVDSLQCMDDGHFSTGRITCMSAERSLEQVTSWCKENYTNAIVISQVTKSGTFAGTNKLKHMVDSMVSLTIEKKDKELMGCRKLETAKNRFGGCGQQTWLSLNATGFQIVAVSEEEE
jgi:DNA repair protein RadA/Sms